MSAGPLIERIAWWARNTGPLKNYRSLA